jgi:hypothetical protein
METKTFSEINNLEETKNMETNNFSNCDIIEVYILNKNKEFIIVFSALDDNICNVLSGKTEEENLEDAAKRLAKEELAAEIKIIGVSKNSFEYGDKKGKSVVAILEPPFQHLKIQGKEISGYKWINKDKIYNYLEKLDQWIQAEKVFKEFSDYF